MTKLLLIFLFFTLPFIHAKILPTLGIPYFFTVSGNFEFTKAIYFNIFSAFIFLGFFVEILFLRKKNAASFPWQGKEFKIEVLGGIFLVLFLSTLFSVSLFISLIGDTEKGHTTLMFFNLLGLFIILKNLEKDFLKKLIFTSLLAGIGVSLLALKELFFETYNYGELSSRALGSFGHPNYLAGYLLLLLPFSGNCCLSPFPKERIQVWIRIIVTLILLTTLFFTKSFWALILALGYIILSQTHLGISSLFKRRGLQIFLFVLFSLSCIILIQFFPEKLHSFLSRFYLWETTLKIIFSDPKIFFFGGGTETLPYFFDSFKVPQVYIFENFGFTADRPHSFFLNIFFHFGVFGVLLFLYLLSKFALSLGKRKYPKGEGGDISPEKISIILFLLFGIFHFFSIASYIVVILVVAFFSAASFSSGRERIQDRDISGKITGIILLIITLISLTGSYFSLKLYQSEILYSQKKYELAEQNFSHPKYLIEREKYSEAAKLEGVLSQGNLREQIITSPERFSLCETLTQNYSSAENFFYCGDLFWRLGKEDIAKTYYSLGLLKLPDLWNNNSPYWDNYFIKNSITGNRFFSPKFSSLSEILEKVQK